MGFTVMVPAASTPAGRSMLHELSAEPVTLLACECAGRPDCACEFSVHPSDDPEFVGDLVTLCLQHEIDVLVPMRPTDLIAIERARKLFEGIGVQVWLAPIPSQATRSLARRIIQLGERERSQGTLSAMT